MTEFCEPADRARRSARAAVKQQPSAAFAARAERRALPAVKLLRSPRPRRSLSLAAIKPLNLGKMLKPFSRRDVLLGEMLK